MDTDENGYKGACYACEPVGELNVKLTAEIAELKSDRAMLKSMVGKLNKELDLYEGRGYPARKVRADAIREMVDKESGGFDMPVTQMIEYADNLEQGE